MRDLAPFLAGAFSGTLSTLLLQPLDVAKTRLQLQSRPTPSMRQVLWQIGQKEGLRGLWRGLMPSLLRTVPGVGIYFSSVDFFTQLLCSASEPRGLEWLVCGMLARTVAGTLTMPFTVLKTRFESGMSGGAGVQRELLLMNRKEGLRGNFRGLVATVMRDVPYSGIFYMFYNQLKFFSSQVFSNDSSSSSSVIIVMCSFSAGALAALVTQPADVVKTRMQVSSVSLTACVCSIYQQEGLGGFTRGLLPRLVRRTAMSVVAWASYEHVLAFYRDNQADQ